MTASLIPPPKDKRAPTYAITLLPFVLVLLVAVVARIHAAIVAHSSAASVSDAGAPDGE
jgi:hypothetical protein